MPAGILEIDASPTIVAVDLTCMLHMRVRPMRHAPLLHPVEDLIEIRFAHEKGIVLHLHFHAVSVEKRQRYLVVYVYVKKWPERHRRRAVENARKEFRRHALVPGVNDRVVQ